MGLSVGIVGLPNVGKSTTFNALTKTQNAQAANYAFCTIEPNKASVNVPDVRLNELAKIVKPERIMYSSVDFVDIAGLVKGASKGEGLGNKFLANIRECDLILHIVRCFDDGNIIHVENSVNPIRDIEIINLELILADIEQLTKKKDKLAKEAKANVKGAKESLQMLEDLLIHLEEGKLASEFANKDSNEFIALNKELRLLSAKEVIYGVNVSEDELTSDNEYVKQVREYANKSNHLVLKLCAKLEEDLIDMPSDEANEFLKELGVEESGLDAIIKASFAKLNLISYFTAGVLEVRSWTIHKGDKAPRAASVIHNDFEKGFIKAEVISYEDYINCGGESKAKEAGKLRLEGKDYVVQDGDVMHFRFNV